MGEVYVSANNETPHLYNPAPYNLSMRQQRKEKQMEWHDRIHSAPEILSGKPVVKGTRISVELLVGLIKVV